MTLHSDPEARYLITVAQPHSGRPYHLRAGLVRPARTRGPIGVTCDPHALAQRIISTSALLGRAVDVEITVSSGRAGVQPGGRILMASPARIDLPSAAQSPGTSVPSAGRRTAPRSPLPNSASLCLVLNNLSRRSSYQRKRSPLSDDFGQFGTGHYELRALAR